MSVERPQINDSLAKRNAVILAMTQALGSAAASIVISTGSLVGYALLGNNKSFSTLPITAMVLGTAIAMLPAGMIMGRFGRRTGFAGAALVGVCAGLIAAYAIYIASFPLFVLACGLTGTAGAFTQQYRFAAADTASEEFKPKAISWVMAGGVLAGVVGPQTVIWTKDLFLPVLFIGTYLALAGLALVCFCFLLFLRIPRPQKPVDKKAAGGRPMSVIMRQPRFVVAVTCAVTSYALMSLVMTAAPLAMVGCGLTQTDATLGIQWHVLAMFAPSFFTGNLIARFGKEKIVATGLALLAACSVVALMGLDLANFWTALILLGLGWNFGF
ncbi:MAG: MFS transporter, partial [Rhodobacteraceae bacterium]|nr:MFS transporter [Paracoccaceae bacterium]